MLKHETEERSVPTWRTPTQSVQGTTPRVNHASVSRADAEEILRRAAQLQSDEQDRISVAELESLALERGISLRFVKQAMKIPDYRHLQSSKPMMIAPVRLTRLQWQVSAAAVVLYWFLGTATPLYYAHDWEYYSAYPLFIAMGLGYFLRYKRAGIVASLALLAANWFGIRFVSGWSSYSGPPLIPVLFPSTLAAWIAAGAVGAALRQWAASRQLPFEPTVLTASDMDR